MEPSQSIAVLTASFGDGHNSAAAGVAAALDREGFENTGAFDLLTSLRPQTMRVLGGGYRKIITHCPTVWRWLYACADRIPLGGDTPDGLPFVTRGTAEFLNRLQPSAVVSTYPLYGHLVERLFGSAPLPFGLLSVVTDSTSINRCWINKADGHYAVTDSESAEFFATRGVEKGRIHITGFPVHPAFGALRPKRVERSLPDPFHIVYVPSTRTPTVVKTLSALREFANHAPVAVALTCVLGRHEPRLRSAVERAVPEGTKILGWTRKMPDLLGSHHLLIGKAGGAAVQEALAAACPMLINYIVPGQEEGNAERLCSAGAGAMMPDPSALAAYLNRLVADAGAHWLEMRAASHRSGRTSAKAAETIASLAVELGAEASRN